MAEAADLTCRVVLRPEHLVEFVMREIDAGGIDEHIDRSSFADGVILHLAGSFLKRSTPS